MALNFENKIKRLELENFTCFGKVEMDFSPGINVFIGENGTGKTHLLKVLYGLSSAPQGSSIVLKKIFKVFSETDLIKNKGDEANIILIYGDKTLSHKILKTNTEAAYIEEPPSIYLNSNKLFLPTSEMLSWFKGFIPAYENRESYIDETYYHLGKALHPLPLKGISLDKQKPLYKELEEAIQIKVIRKGDDFFVAFIDEQKEYASPIVATGINKIAQLIYLIMNGSLTKDTILFWDEPEANLNPKYILIVAKFLQTLANAGCQIFVATHDYVLPYELSLSKEYGDVIERPVPDMKFFALHKGVHGTEIEEGRDMPELHHDAIHEGLSLHNRRENMLFKKSVNRNS